MMILPNIIALRIRIRLTLWRLWLAPAAWRTVRRALERMAPAG